jgi:hypothetical protein
MVLLASSFDQSKWLRADDLAQATKLRIKNVTAELIGQGVEREQKLVVWFTNEKRGLVLNKTNNRTLRGAFGDDAEGWAGKVIEVFPTVTEMAGTMKPALRVRIPPPKQASGNGPTEKPQTTAEMLAAAGEDPPTRPIPTADPASQVDDFDDEIPF